MIIGKQVRLISYGDKIITRTVVSVAGDVIFVCKSEEFKRAEIDRRQPVSIGFRREYVLSA